jgi:radical SAM superfamily enzyme YgiQ (UPF0313 family)
MKMAKDMKRIGDSEQTMEMPPGIRRVVVVLIKPTSYDDDGFPYTFARGVLPSNSLAALYALTRHELARLLPPGVESEIHVFDEYVARHIKRHERLLDRFPEEGTRLIVGMVAVQTAQFPRACDLIKTWQDYGATCVIGGFHVSGIITMMLDGVNDPSRGDIPCPGKLPADLRQLMDQGTVIFHGEAEALWGRALADIIAGSPRPIYRGGRPDFRNAPLPVYPQGYFEGNFVTTIRTFDTSRGCPFACRFCTIINVQGRAARERDPAAIVAEVKRLCEEEKRNNSNKCNDSKYKGSANFFFTDDNFARSHCWRPLLQGLADLRRQGYELSFMIEADLACGKDKTFIPLLAEAGCGMIFQGVESMNPANLVEAKKNQNNIEQFAQLWATCQAYGITIHVAYIIGFPHDTPESASQDVQKLVDMGADQVSFFMLTPLPGSEDWIRAVVAGTPMDGDYSHYDSFHAVWDHPLMSREQWLHAYQAAWRSFYTVSNMIKVLKRWRNAKDRRDLLKNMMWYRWSFAAERTHPMIAGLYKVRRYRQRRPDAPPLSYPRYLLQEGWRHLRYVGRFLAEFYRFQHVVYETEFAPYLAERSEEFTGRLHGVGDWARRTFGRVMTRRWLNRFWMDYGHQRWQLLLNPFKYGWHLTMIPYAMTEVVYSLRFAWMLLRLVRTSMTT